MTGVYDGAAHDLAVLAMVKSVWPLTGDGAAPDGLTYDDEKRLIQPYCVVYPLGSGSFDGSLGTVQDDAWPVTQVTYVGRTREQAAALRQKVRTGLLGHSLTVAGRQVGPVRLQQELPTTRDDDVQPALFYAVDRYLAYTTPA